jgi:hypothetical protein
VLILLLSTDGAFLKLGKARFGGDENLRYFAGGGKTD